MTSTRVSLDPTVLTLLIGVVLPMLVALITKRFADSWWKAAILIVLAAITSVLQQIFEHGGNFDLWPTVVLFVQTLLTAIVAHFGVLQPMHLTGSDGVIQLAAPGGVGSERNVTNDRGSVA